MNEKINKLTEKQQREFAFICASREVENTDCDEIKEYFTLILMGEEMGILQEIKKEGAYRAAYRVVYSAAYSAANRVGETKIQHEILNNMLLGD